MSGGSSSYLSWKRAEQESGINVSEFDYSLTNDYDYLIWLSDYEAKEEVNDEEDEDDNEDLGYDESCDEDEEEEVKESNLLPSMKEEEEEEFTDLDYSSYFKYGSHLTSLIHSSDSIPSSIYLIDGSNNAATTESAFDSNNHNTFFCSEPDVIKMILEMLFGSENELFTLSKEEERKEEGGGRGRGLSASSFMLTAIATRLRLSSTSLSPSVLLKIFQWFVRLASLAAFCRDYANTTFSSANHYLGKCSTATVVPEHCICFHGINL